jgi:ribonuclease BN (tRNA processing enzyme)
VRLTVIGSSPSWPNPGEASSGYLVDTSGGSLLLDCGNGVLGRLRAHREAGPTAIVLSHLDPDHISDLWSVMFGVTYGPLDWSAVTTLYAPPGGRVVLAEVLDAFGLTLAHLERAIAVREYRTTEPLAVAGATLRFARTRHSAHSYATRIEDDGRTLVFTGDAGLTAGLVEHARGADLLLAEATFAVQPESPDATHMTARQTAGLGRDAAVGRLLLTHLAAEDREAALDAARAVFEATELALPGATFDV